MLHFEGVEGPGEGVVARLEDGAPVAQLVQRLRERGLDDRCPAGHALGLPPRRMRLSLGSSAVARRSVRQP